MRYIDNYKSFEGKFWDELPTNYKTISLLKEVKSVLNIINKKGF